MLELKNLSFEVSEGGTTKKIIDNINLTVEDGKFAVITGPNGGGKSTLAKLIMGIEKPTSGKIFFDGADVTEKAFPSVQISASALLFSSPFVSRALMCLTLCVFPPKDSFPYPTPANIFLQ